MVSLHLAAKARSIARNTGGLVLEARRRRDLARQLRAKAYGDWVLAKQWFEDQLLKGG